MENKYDAAFPWKSFSSYGEGMTKEEFAKIYIAGQIASDILRAAGSYQIDIDKVSHHIVKFTNAIVDKL